MLWEPVAYSTPSGLYGSDILAEMQENMHPQMRTLRSSLGRENTSLPRSGKERV